MFEPFGQLIRFPKAVLPRAETGARLARWAIYLFWALVAVILVARAALVFHGTLFDFAP